MQQQRERVEYENIRGRLKTGDLVLFAGRGLISSLITSQTDSVFSHVGLVLRSHDPDMVLCFESTSINNVPDVEVNRIVKGVQVSALSERIRRYRGGVVIRHMQGGFFPEAVLNKFRSEVAGRPYEKDYIELARAALDIPGFEQQEDLTSLFCSELVAEALQRCGVLHPDIPSNEYVPADFSEAREQLDYIGNYHYGPEFIVKPFTE